MNQKLTFYTESAPSPNKFVGRCRQLPQFQYFSKTTRDAALSGIKRLVKRSLKQGAATQAPVPTTNAKQKVTRVAFVVDRSGSMASLTAAAVQALNANIRTIREEARRQGQVAIISVISFDTSVSTVRSAMNADAITEVRDYEVRAGGSTALFDAVKQAITELERTPVGPNEDVAYLVMALTDGEENASSTRAPELKRLMQRVQGTDRWTLTFLLPPGNKYTFVRSFDIPEGNVAEWEGSIRGVQTYAALNTNALGTYFTNRSKGQTYSTAFYQTDLSGLSTKDLQSKLNDLSGQVKVLPVEKETDIKSFVESKLGSYTPGSAFYQLTKDEKVVQSYKDLLVMEKGKKSVFGGADARAVLGIPQGQNLKIRPGNHGNFDIFVQSTSLNRKLVRGTKLLVKS